MGLKHSFEKMKPQLCFCHKKPALVLRGHSKKKVIIFVGSLLDLPWFSSHKTHV